MEALKKCFLSLLIETILDISIPLWTKQPTHFPEVEFTEHSSDHNAFYGISSYE